MKYFILVLVITTIMVEHIKKKSRNIHWKNIVNSCGYVVEILIDGLSWEEACIKEIQLIGEIGRRDLNLGSLVNLTDGGDGLHNPSVETRNKIRNSFLGKTRIEIYGAEKAKEITNKIVLKNIGKKRTEKFKEEQSKRFTGEKNPMFGKSQSDEFKKTKREYMLNNNPGKNKTEETKKKISDSKKGIPSKIKGIPRKKITCPYCGKIGGEGLMNRWHFNNCKNK
ncbi:MAG: NUMOD3 domain-containing DNA-binding protein [Bacteroidales bacterium]|jgi:ribosomal protein L28|nr:NUMOD3 domain-containing DNA-binding protein [Bacteroidales bacterium]